jgi:hypothetical protein
MRHLLLITGTLIRKLAKYIYGFPLPKLYLSAVGSET